MHYEESYVFFGKNGPIDLTVFENKLLSLLLRAKGVVVTYEEICKETYKQEIDKYYLACISQRVVRLRKKLKGEIDIKAKPKIGYRIKL